MSIIIINMYICIHMPDTTTCNIWRNDNSICTEKQWCFMLLLLSSSEVYVERKGEWNQKQ